MMSKSNPASDNVTGSMLNWLGVGVPKLKPARPPADNRPVKNVSIHNSTSMEPPPRASSAAVSALDQFAIWPAMNVPVAGTSKRNSLAPLRTTPNPKVEIQVKVDATIHPGEAETQVSAHGHIKFQVEIDVAIAHG